MTQQPRRKPFDLFGLLAFIWKVWRVFEITTRILGMILGTAILLEGAYLVYYKIPWRLIKPFMQAHPQWRALILSLVVLLVGAGLSSWKNFHALSYGTVEAAFGLVVSFNNLSGIAPHFALVNILGVGSGIYIVSRGFNNIADARKLQPTTKAETAGA